MRKRDTTWGARLRQARNEAGMGQEEAAAAIGLTTKRRNQRVGNFEKETETPTPNELRALCEIYEVTSDWVLFNREPKRPVQRGEAEARLLIIQRLADLDEPMAEALAPAKGDDGFPLMGPVRQRGPRAEDQEETPPPSPTRKAEGSKGRRS